MSDTIIAGLLGLLEGLTEFIPVSSTGHILLAGHFLGFNSSGKTFEVLIQLGAILAIVGVYAGRLIHVFASAPHDPAARRFILSVLIAFLPAVIVGVAAHDIIKKVLFETPILIASMLVLGGVILLWVDRLNLPERETDAMHLSPAMAFKIGLFQCLAMIPGVSRSGSTIVGAMLMGVSKRAAAEFSFFLSMPTMAGAFAYDLYKSRDLLNANDIDLIAIGFVAAFISGVFVVRGLLDFVGRHGYAAFGWWRIIVGTAALAFIYVGY
ncbi:undecaprenyl-diphosphate phosphatase [Sinirhodobacter sp. WL0062]|uniref:Undecaprenyl-diphosphatase n=1 Tax=Rhodobacter flavimaris TaxID=2907145 RepID=A0ABS8YZI4_9RHOB|nr:undecaprenyl-diphosphate phosphatase [Sinirhodobacter sp. WL0062]MCE5974166.1 undecaprenyl-diphosphate phosphatase [Sinirhodobacter sp. WL0062]